MHRTFLLFLLALTAFLFTGCAAYVGAVYAAVEKEQTDAIKASSKRAKIYETKVAQRYPDARTGDILRVQAKGGLAGFDQPTEFEPLDFHIARGETRTINIYKRRYEHVMTADARLSKDGSTLSFNPSYDDAITIRSQNGWKTPTTQPTPSSSSERAVFRNTTFTLHYIKIP